jgi:hypothetical protein
MAQDPMDKTLSDLLDFCESNNRVYPTSACWHTLRCILPDDATGEEPPPIPVILVESLKTSDIMKRIVFRKHLQWAYGHGVLEKVDQYLRSLTEVQWHHADGSYPVHDLYN